MIVNKVQQIVRPRLTRLYMNYPPHMRYPKAPPSLLTAVGSDILFLAASVFILAGMTLKADRRSLVLILWILMQVFLLTVIFRPTPNYHIRRYSLPFMFAALPFLYPGIRSLRQRVTAGRLTLLAIVLSTWMCLVIRPLVRWGGGWEMWTRKGLEILVEKDAGAPAGNRDGARP
jgi:hypothetical protein